MKQYTFYKDRDESQTWTFEAGSYTEAVRIAEEALGVNWRRLWYVPLKLVKPDRAPLWRPPTRRVTQRREFPYTIED